MVCGLRRSAVDHRRAGRFAPRAADYIFATESSNFATGHVIIANLDKPRLYYDPYYATLAF